MNLETVDIESKLAEYAALKSAMNDELKPHVLAMNSIEEKYTSSLRDLEQIIKDATLLRETSFKSDIGQVKYRKGYGRVSWDDHALLGYAVDHEGILAFRKETEVKPTVSIEVY